MNISSEEIKKNAEKAIEKAEKLESLTKHPAWPVYVELLDDLLKKELEALAGVKLDENYLRKIGFVQETAFIRAIPKLIKDKDTRNFLLTQGRAKAIETMKTLPFLYRKYKKAAEEQLQQILNPVNLEQGKEEFHKSTFERS